MTRRARFLGGVLLILVLVLLPGWTSRRDEAALAAITPGRAISSRVEYDLRRCSPAGVDLSPIVYFSIRSGADGLPEISGCTRYAVLPKTTARHQRR